MAARRMWARDFYPEASPEVIESYLRDFTPPELPGRPLVAILPHAGWYFSGRVTARTLYTCRENGIAPKSFVFLGAVHAALLKRPALDPEGAWETPFGLMEIDQDVALSLSAADLSMDVDPEAHRGEHSIEVSLPFLKYFFPQARFVPIAVPRFPEAPEFGRRLGEALQGKDAFLLATTDLTHYGLGYGFAPAGTDPERALPFLRENDQRLIDLVLQLKAEEILPEVDKRHNACGPGALSAAVAAGRAMGGRQEVLVEYRTSNDVMPSRGEFRAVGYAGLIIVG